MNPIRQLQKKNLQCHYWATVKMCDMAATKSLMLRNNIILKTHLVSTSVFLILLTKTLELIISRTMQKIPIMLNKFPTFLM